MGATHKSTVIPAKAGIAPLNKIPAFAGMTEIYWSARQ